MTFLSAVVFMTISSATPLIFASLGGVISEKSGVVNIGIEGMILIGAFAGMAVSYYTGNAYLGVIFGGLAGGLVALLHGYIAISLGGPQAVSSTGIILFSSGITAFGLRLMFNRAGNSDAVAYLPNSPIFKGIPVIGEQLAKFSPLVYLAFLVAGIVFYIFKYTPIGLRIHTVGENPKVAETLGINVWGIRYSCVMISGFLAGIAGSYLSLGQMNMFQEGMSAGRGYLAIAAVILGRWKPLYVVLACLFFSVFDAIQLQIQMMPNSFISPTILNAVPYIVCILVLAFSFGSSKGPKSNGVAYLKRGK